MTGETWQERCQFFGGGSSPPLLPLYSAWRMVCPLHNAGHRRPSPPGPLSRELPGEGEIERKAGYLSPFSQPFLGEGPGVRAKQCTLQETGRRAPNSGAERRRAGYLKPDAPQENPMTPTPEQLAAFAEQGFFITEPLYEATALDEIA